MQHLPVADDTVERCSQFVADVGQEHAFRGTRLVGGFSGIVHLLHGIAQLVGHVIKSCRQVAEFAAVFDIVYAVIEITAAYALGAGLELFQGLIGVPDQKKSQRGGEENGGEEADNSNAVSQGDGAINDVGALHGDEGLALFELLQALAGLQVRQRILHVRLEIRIVVALVKRQPTVQQDTAAL